jgi:HPr kinase/phosphorylase
MTVREPPRSERGLSVGALISDAALKLEIKVAAGAAGLGREIRHPRIQKSGLAMVGHLHGIVTERMQVLGETELSYLEGLPQPEQVEAAERFFSTGLACVLITRGATAPASFVTQAEATGTPLLVCEARSSAAITAVHALLDERLAPRTRIHGVLVDVFEVGVLMLGKSGIGKSETALELVMNGHRLVADDVVECDYRPPGMVFAEPAELLRHHIEVRGLGILDIKQLFGVTAIRDRKRIDLVVRLEMWSDEAPVDRIGLDERSFEILGVQIREIVIPVRPGRITSAIVEIAARSELLRQAGHDSNREFIARVDAQVTKATVARRPRATKLAPRDVERVRLLRGVSESAVPPPVKGKP